MSHPLVSSARRGAVALALLVAIAGCSSAKPTPIIVLVTPSPAQTEAETPTPEPTPEATATPEATPTDTPAAATATPSASPIASPSAASSSTLAPVPSMTPGPATACTGSSDPVHGAEYTAFWTAAAKALPFSVYCGVVPGGWFFNGSTYTQPNGGHLGAKYSYKTTSGPSIQIDEGGDASKFTSVTPGATLGSAIFGDLPGTLYAGSSGGFVLQVAPGTARAYQAVGTGVTKATFVNIVDALMKVAKS